jgi:ABC-2 type transport system ATP-binding protein
VYAIKVEGLTKKFNGVTAVDNITFSVESGELFGLLGPNGAGKTTMINMLSTLLKPTSGYAEVAGFNVVQYRNDVRNSIGVVFQETALDNRLTGKENLEFHSVMYGMDKKASDERIKEVMELVELTDKANFLVEKYSGGMKRRLEIARGLIHHPKVLFLDEPSLGLDAQTRRHIWDYIKKLNEEENVTIILTTHYMEEADYLCERVAIVDHGKIVALETPSNLKDSLGGDIISLELQECTDPNAGKQQDCAAFEGDLKSNDWLKGIDRHDGTLNLKVKNSEKHIPDVFAIAEKRGIAINSVNMRKPSLEDVFLRYTGKTIREQEVTPMDRHRQMARGRPH